MLNSRIVMDEFLEILKKQVKDWAVIRNHIREYPYSIKIELTDNGFLLRYRANSFVGMEERFGRLYFGWKRDTIFEVDWKMLDLEKVVDDENLRRFYESVVNQLLAE